MTYFTQQKETDTQFHSTFEQRVVFFLVAVGVFSLTFGILFLIDFLPEKPGTSTTDTEEVIAVTPDTALLPSSEEITEETPVVGEPVMVEAFPNVLIIDALDKRIPVLNPESRAVTDLDAALLKGAVRHPDSADFENKGTIFILAHSSYLPNVINKNFQAFNGIQKLVWGDTIRLQSGDVEYTYRVDRAYKATAVDAEVEMEWGRETLVLATCNSFGTKDDRFIVESTLISTKPL